MLTPRVPAAGLFQHTLAAILLSRAFALVFSWYKVIIALSLCFSSRGLQHTVHASIVATKIVSQKVSFLSFQSGQHRMQTAEWVLNVDGGCILSFRLIRVTCHLTTYRASRNRFSAFIFHDYLHYCGIFLSHFLIFNVQGCTHTDFHVYALRPIYTARLCRMRQAYDRPTTWLKSRKRVVGLIYTKQFVS